MISTIENCLQYWVDYWSGDGTMKELTIIFKPIHNIKISNILQLQRCRKNHNQDGHRI